jgi:predicted DNA-binding transcriptional regulator YafY
MLYGSNFVRRLKGKKDLEPSEIRYGIHDPVITGLSWDEETGDYILEGDYFTDYSRVYGDHIRIRSEKIDRQHIRIPVNSMKKAKELTVIQVSAENEKIHYNESAPWQPDWEVLEESKPAVE